MNFESLSEINDRIGEHIVRRSFWLKTLAAILVVAVCVGIAFYYWPDQSNAASVGPRFATASGDCVNDTSAAGTINWSSPGNAFSNNTTDATVALDGTTSEYIKCTNFGFTTAMIPTGSIINGIVVTIERSANSTPNLRDAAVRIVKSGTIGTTDKSTATAYTSSMIAEDHGGATDLWGETWTVADVTASNFGAAFSALNSSSAGGAETVSVDYISITVYFSPPPPVLTQRSYIFEQDDGANVNSNSNSSSANTSLTGVKKGERVTARLQVDNTATSDFTDGQFELFYDRNDGAWTRVNGDTAVYPGSGNCTDTNYDCTAVDGTGLINPYTDIAVSNSGQVWASYRNNVDGVLRVLKYVGSGGVGCTNSAWSCTSVVAATQASTSIAFDGGNNPWISYTNTGLRVARYVGSGGTGCTDTAWSCTQITTDGSVNYSSLAYSATGGAYIAYYDSDGADLNLKVAQYVGSGGTGCASTAWTCTTIDSTGDVGAYVSIAITASNVAWISYRDGSTNNNLKVAQYVGTGGSGCDTAAWSCTAVDSTGDVGAYTSIAVGISDKIWVSYWASGVGLRVAEYVSSGGTGCAVASWSCTTVGGSGLYTAIATSLTGQPTIVQHSSSKARLSRYVGSGGSGCSSSAWSCADLDATSATIGSFGSIAISPSGQTWVSYLDQTNQTIRVSQAVAKNEIIPAHGLSGSNGNALTTNEAGACTGGTTFSNGTWQEGVNTSSPSTIAASKCSEIAFMINTSQAEVGVTYRLALKNKTNNRGLSAYSNYPTFTIVSAGNDTVRASKDVIARLGSPTACTNTDYDCEDVDDHASESIGFQAYIDLGPDGNPWISYRNTTQGSLMLAKYVGSGGSGCNGGNAKWNCEVVDSTGIDAVYATSLKVDAAGKAWIVSFDRVNEDVRIAEHVGSGGSGCGGGNTAWNCYTLYDATVNSDGHMHPNMTLDGNGIPWISFALDTNTNSTLYDYELMVARYVGSGGTGCTSAAWTCELVDGSSGDVGTFSSIAINLKTGKPWVSYFERGNWNLRVAEYVGSGGSGCSGSATWTCTVVHSTNDAGAYSSIALDNDGNPWVAYYESVGLDIYVANFVGSGGSGCAVSSWSCVRVDGASTTVGQEHGKRWLAMDPDGNPWLTYRDNTSSSNLLLKTARYVGSGGSGCDSTAWSCSIITNGGSVGIDHHSSLVFDASGALWLAFRNNSNASLRVAKTVYPPFSTKARYSLDGQGYTYAGTDDTSFDQMASGTHIPLYRFSTVHANNSTNIQPTWIGKSDVAAGTNNIKAQVYRYGTTNAWVDMATNSTCSANTDCTITPTAISANLSEYYEAEGSSYLLHFRVHQGSGTTKTLQTDCFSAATGCGGGGGPTPTPTPQMDQKLRGGNWWLDGVRQLLHLD